MKIALLSDTHGYLPEMPEVVDAALHAGDICPDIYKGGKFQLAWLEEKFSPWAEKFGKPIYMTWGNHDFVGERLREGRPWDQFLPKTVWIAYDEWLDVCNKKVWFSPWSPLFGGWAWMKPDLSLIARYAHIPDDTQIIVSHTPPLGIGDVLDQAMLVGDAKYYSNHVGSKALSDRIQELPQLETVICGHIHYARGHYDLEVNLGNGEVDHVQVINAAYVNEAYVPVDAPIPILSI